MPASRQWWRRGVLSVLAYACLLVTASGGGEVYPSFWRRGHALRCLGLRGAGGLHRKGAGDYYDDVDDDEEYEHDWEDSRSADTRQHRAHGGGPMPGLPGSALMGKKIGHLSPAARLFLAAQDEDIMDGDEEDGEKVEEDVIDGLQAGAYAQEEDEHDATDSLDAVQSCAIMHGRQDERPQPNFIGAGVDGTPMLHKAPPSCDNGGNDFHGEALDDETGSAVSACGSGLALKGPRLAAAASTVTEHGLVKPCEAAVVSASQPPASAPASAAADASATGGQQQSLNAVVEETCAEGRASAGRNSASGQQEGSGKDAEGEADGSLGARAKSTSPLRPSAHALALKIQRSCSMHSHVSWHPLHYARSLPAWHAHCLRTKHMREEAAQDLG